MVLLLKVAPWGEMVSAPIQEEPSQNILNAEFSTVQTPSALMRVLYLTEATLVVVPSVLFLLLSFPWLLAALSLKAWTPSFVVFLLWLAGWFGVVVLVQMILRLLSGQATQIRFLWTKLSLGFISAIYPIYFVFNSPPDGGNRIGFLLFLMPVAVGLHWAWALNSRRVQ